MNSQVAEILKKYGSDAQAFWPSKLNPEIWNGDVPGANAVVLWLALRAQFELTGIWPVLRGSAVEEPEEFYNNPSEILSQVPSYGLNQLLAPRLTERIEAFQQMFGDYPSDLELKAFVAKVDASGAMSFGGRPASPTPWPDTKKTQPNLEIHSVSDMGTRRLRRHVQLSLIPLSHAYEVPAYLGFGGWNDSPMPELQVAVLREWHKLYGAVPIAVTGDVLECVVDRPPQTEEQAMALAAEQWIFCDDIVSQGTQTIRNLAIEIWRSPQWFFWWD